MKSFKQYLQEAPISNYQLIGDFDTPHSFRDKRDRAILQHPKSIEITKRKWANAPYDFDLYFVNTAAANKHTEEGLVTIEQVKERLGDEVYRAVLQDYNKDHIQVIFTNNKGAQRAPMTNWIMAHRLLHRFNASRGGSKETNAHYYYSETSDLLIKNLSEILSEYGVSDFPQSDRAMASFYSFERAKRRKDQLTMKSFLTQVSTFKSARDNKVRDWFEFLNEYGAQYITTGKIKFNPAPKCFTASYGVANGGKRALCAEESQLPKINDSLSDLAEQLEYAIDSLLRSVINDIFIM